MQHFTTNQATEFLNSLGITFTRGTLSVWRSLGRGPRFKRIGRKVYYTREALEEFAKGKSFETEDSPGD